MPDLTGAHPDPERNPVDEREVFQVLPRAVVVTDVDGRILLWNKPAEALFGWAAPEVVGRSVLEVLAPAAGEGPDRPDQSQPDQPDQPDLLDQLDLRELAGWSGDLRVSCRSGERLRIWITISAVVDDSGSTIALVGASEDVTHRRLLEQTAEDLTERLQLALDAGQLGTWVWDIATGAVEWDARLEQLFGLAPGTFDGTFDTYVGLLHPEDSAGVLASIEEATAAKSRYIVEHRVVWPDGSIHWVSGAGQVMVDRDGNVTGTIGCVTDVTDRVLAERERQRFTLDALIAAEDERVSRERLEFLGQINDALNEASEQSELMSAVVEAAVPRLGDWCAIFVLRDDGSAVPDMAIAHVDPAMVDYARRLRGQFPYDPAAPGGIPAVIRTGRTEFVPDIDEDVLDQSHLGEHERAIVNKLALRSSIAIPLIRRGRVLGAMQFVMAASSRRYTPDDVTLAHAVGSRIASSLENRRLAERQRVIAATLQASLLPDELPEIPGVEVAVRYWATGEGTEVGGDFYDLFPITGSTWGVVIGDVCGTGPGAAAVTGMARHTIASAAGHGDAPEVVLRHLNRTLRLRRTDSFCTVAYAELRVDAEGARLALVSGGHPLPVVATAAQGATHLGAPGTLIGVFDDIEVTTVDRTLQPGDAVIFYTDGVTDVPPPHELVPDDFAAMVAEEAAGCSSAEDLADRLHGRLSAILDVDRRSDDIALLILRVAPAAS